MIWIIARADEDGGWEATGSRHGGGGRNCGIVELTEERAGAGAGVGCKSKSATGRDTTADPPKLQKLSQSWGKGTEKRKGVVSRAGRAGLSLSSQSR